MWFRSGQAAIRRYGLNPYLVKVFVILELTDRLDLAKKIVRRDPLAQSVEHFTFNEGVDGSNPSRITNFLSPFRLEA